ncbi:MAG TPA: transposase [Chthonomonadaceae bacterium]|nr:transposase [Chthonomonadaceae bacterium]
MLLVGEDIERDLYRFITGACLELDCTPLAVNGMPDHVHVLMSLSATIV